MKKIDISTLPQENNASNLLSILGLSANGVIRTRNPIADLRVSDVLIDADKLHELYNPMLAIKIAAGSSLNVPFGLGIIVHVQRQAAHVVNSSQVIGQLFFSPNAVYFRTGQGDGENINFTEWKAL